MWNKPRELTAYEGVGFEIAYRYTAGVRAARALKSWDESPRHRAVILNQGKWNDNRWESIGVGVAGEYAVIWFGEDPDPQGYWAGAETEPDRSAH